MKIKSAITTLSFSMCLLLSNKSVVAQTYKSVSEAKGLAVGTKAPRFTAKDQYSKTYYIKRALKKGPVVLIFYRGQWCPVCNKHLKALEDSLSQIYAKGASVVAVSPESPEFLKMTAAKTHASFTLLYDEDYKIEDAFDVTFQPDEKTINMYNTRLNARLDKSHSDNSNRLPVPATFIIDKDGKIVWRQFNPDYHIRATVQEILQNIPANK